MSTDRRNRRRFLLAALFMAGLTSGALTIVFLTLVNWPVPVEILVGVAIGAGVGRWGGKTTAVLARLDD